MSISKGRYVACFKKPCHSWYGRYYGKCKLGSLTWSIIVYAGSGRRRAAVAVCWVDNIATFAEAKLWAVARLNELVAQEQEV